MNSKEKLLHIVNNYSLLKKIVNITRPPSLKFDLYGSKNRKFFSNLILESGISGAIIDIGSGPVKNGNTKGLTKEILARRKAMDYKRYPGVEIVGTVEDIPLESQSVAGVLFQGVIEHIGDPQKAIIEISRILKTDGVVYVEAPFMQHFHYDPEDNYRFTDDGLEKIFSQFDFKIIDKGPLHGPSAALADVLIEYIAVFTRLPLFYWLTKWILGWLLFWIKYLDIIFFKNKMSKFLCFSVYLIGKKR